MNVENGKVHLRRRDKRTDADAPTGPFFTIAGYAPTTMQMLMVRYWASRLSGATATLRAARARWSLEGKTAIHRKAAAREADRYTIEGLIWGRETLWFDASRNLVAAITTDAEFDHFEAIRDGYESALGDFVARAGADGMAALAEYLARHSRQPRLYPGDGWRHADRRHRGRAGGGCRGRDHNGRIVAAGPRSTVKIPRRAK